MDECTQFIGCLCFVLFADTQPVRSRTHILLCDAGILRYQVDFQTMELPDDLGNDFDLDDY